MSDPAPRITVLTGEEAAQWAAFEVAARPGLDRITCAECTNRSGAKCIPLGMGHVPLHLHHRCAHYRASKRRSA